MTSQKPPLLVYRSLGSWWIVVVLHFWEDWKYRRNEFRHQYSE
ncbi:hypothetical protein [Acinetobacter soli]|nr:hypothetical protein [Acinetobacter soli]MDQ8943079.1 hypothetical protein [Acinetobacter soli]